MPVPFAAIAQETGRTYRLGILVPLPREAVRLRSGSLLGALDHATQNIGRLRELNVVITDDLDAIAPGYGN